MPEFLARFRLGRHSPSPLPFILPVISSSSGPVAISLLREAEGGRRLWTLEPTFLVAVAVAVRRHELRVPGEQGGHRGRWLPGVRSRPPRHGEFLPVHFAKMWLVLV